MGVQPARVQLRGVLLPPQKAQAPPHARGSHVGLPHPYRFGFFLLGFEDCLSPTSSRSPRARLPRLSHSLPRPGEGRLPLSPGWHGIPALPAHPPRWAIFLRQSPLFYNFFLMTQYSRFLEDSLASSTGLRLPACTLFYAPKQNTRDTSGLIFRKLSTPLSLTSFSQQLRFPLSLVTP